MSARNNNPPSFGSRVNDTVEQVSSSADEQREWIEHLESRLETVESELVARIRKLRERHRQARQEISNELYALAQEMGYLPAPNHSQAQIDSMYSGANLDHSEPASLVYSDHGTDDPEADEVARRLGILTGSPRH